MNKMINQPTRLAELLLAMPCLAITGLSQAGPAEGIVPNVASDQLLSAGRLHACALKPNGTLACWGQNTYGEATPPTAPLRR